MALASSPIEYSQCLDGVEFIFVDEELYLQDAAAECRLRDAFLGTTTNIQEHELILNFSSQLNDAHFDVWMGITFLSNKPLSRSL